ncbi:ammonia-forming cytochrome c nitrite reductase subunit c552 [Actomonas aquatica]|uniref:nitrite reductase (cytochrome; ammonia-forming) n=1 Tax=Actomonas aquatica TaxID=2866162 RepID=A0ABZ1C3S3_9BACT|nr:ammonia-forming cytochrome c nitrite reductase subunit c552 [Opitutus sp. WL0086]WRQ86353.1 ammonia-forming cytochrome c nitrite reductase subunit c552 [Opitutus sp. WL0086]
MKSLTETVERRPWIGWLLFLGTIAGVFAVGLLAASIVERRQETFRTELVQPIADVEPRNGVWGVNFPRQYDSYKRTLEGDFASAHMGSIEIDYLKKNPRMVILWAGYAFSRDYKQGRGHAHAVEDIRNSLRTTVETLPGTCWTCKSTDVPRVIGEIGASAFYGSNIMEMGKEITNAIGCQDCHDPQGMSLRVTRPALVEAFARQGKDINQASHQEMRTLVCAQCHVEYYFKGKDKYLTFPWDKGYSADDMEAYYDAIDFADWVHPLSKTPMIKAQHPDYELYMTGVHAQRGVSCSDCHMPYKSEGGQKFTDHQVRSPLADTAQSCAVCHRENNDTLLTDVYSRQNRVIELLELTENALVAAHIEAKAAWEAGATAEEMKPVLTLIRHAQWRWDWVSSANGYGFHSPVEASRVLGTAVQKAESARNALTRVLFAHGVTDPVAMPDISTKEKAQAYIGLDMDKIHGVKERQKAENFPAWDEAAAEREAQLPAALNADSPRYNEL